MNPDQRHLTGPTARKNTDMRGMHRVRWAAEGEPLMQCSKCCEFLPITLEFWQPIHGLTRCRVCVTEGVSESSRRRRADPAYREFERAAAKAQRKADRTAYQRNYYRQNYSTLARALRAAS